MRTTVFLPLSGHRVVIVQMPLHFATEHFNNTIVLPLLHIQGYKTMKRKCNNGLKFMNKQYTSYWLLKIGDDEDTSYLPELTE